MCIAEPREQLRLPLITFYFAPRLWLPATRLYRERPSEMAILAYPKSANVQHGVACSTASMLRFASWRDDDHEQPLPTAQRPVHVPMGV